MLNMYTATELSTLANITLDSMVGTVKNVFQLLGLTLFIFLDKTLVRVYYAMT